MVADPTKSGPPITWNAEEGKWDTDGCIQRGAQFRQAKKKVKQAAERGDVALEREGAATVSDDSDSSNNKDTSGDKRDKAIMIGMIVLAAAIVVVAIAAVVGLVTKKKSDDMMEMRANRAAKSEATFDPEWDHWDAADPSKVNVTNRLAPVEPDVYGLAPTAGKSAENGTPIYAFAAKPPDTGVPTDGNIVNFPAVDTNQNPNPAVYDVAKQAESQAIFARHVSSGTTVDGPDLESEEYQLASPQPVAESPTLKADLPNQPVAESSESTPGSPQNRMGRTNSYELANK
jgi:hypothetical protein